MIQKSTNFKGLQ